MRSAADIPRIATGLRGLDEILAGGLPERSVTVIAGPPGAGKTILAEQICFHHASADSRALYFTTLSEPTAKTLLYLGQFDFFDAAKLEADVRFVDLGNIAQTGGLEEAAAQITDHIDRVKPALVVVDSFRVFDEIARSREDLRRFGHEIAVKLMVRDCTTLLLGDYGSGVLDANPLFSIVDGLVLLSQERAAGEPRRFLEVVKMRGTAHSRALHRFEIARSGIEIGPGREAARRPGKRRARPVRTP
jgi:circadian clock protein KaiC